MKSSTNKISEFELPDFWQSGVKDFTVVHIDPNVINKVMAKRTGRGFQWKGVNTHFGEFVIKLRDSENIPQEIIDQARKEPGVWHPK